MARRAKRNSNKRDRQSLAKETASLSLEAGMYNYGSIWSKGFSQKEWDNAHLALEWVKTALDIPRCACRVTDPGVLTFIHETYGPYINDYEDKFKSFAWASNQCCADEVWIAHTPFGDFTVILEYFDNHCCGF